MEIRHAILEAKQLSIGYRSGKSDKIILSDLNFTLNRGELTCLLGTNGVGKTTLLRTLSATQPSLSGSLNLLGRPIESYSDADLSKLIGVVLTDKPQAGGLSVYDLVALGRQPHTGFFGRLSRHDHEIIRHAIEVVGIAHKAQSYTAHLSDGERQKVMIAKALVQECPFILLDEPTAFLDVASRLEVLELLHKLAHDENKAILLTTHEIEQTLILADRLWLITPDEQLLCGITEDLVLNHAMDLLFVEKDIQFDLMHGIFSPTVRGDKRTVLQAENEILRHWAQNALNRHGYLCYSEAPDAAPIININVQSAHEIQLNDKKFGSFDSLLAFIRTNC